MDVLRACLFACVLKGSFADFHVNATKKGCMSFDINVDLVNGNVKVQKDNTQVFVRLVFNGVETFHDFGNFIGRISDFDIKTQPETMSFCIVNTTILDGGEYIFQTFSTEVGRRKLYVLDKPDKPVITVINNGTIESENGKISCVSHSTSAPPGLPFAYTWLVNDTTIKNESKYKCNERNKCNELIITVDRIDNFNQYKCVSTEKYGQTSISSETVKIDPKRKPMVTLRPTEGTYKILIHQALTIQCIVLDAYPNVSSFTWKKNNSTMIEQRRDVYTFGNVLRTDAGSYECIASNGMSNGTADIFVDVLYGPTVTPMTNFSVVDGGSITKLCIVESNPPATDDNVTWTKLENATFISDGLHLTINPVNRADHGTYICTVNVTLLPTDGSSSNKLDSKAIHINVLYGPIITLIPSYSQVEGRSIIIRCNIQSNPEPVSGNVIWKKQGNGSFSLQGVQLNISSVNKKDMGIFVCTASMTLQPTNGHKVVKSDNKNVTINVLYGPIISAMSNHDQLVGKSINKACVIDSYPTATNKDVTWTKQGNISFSQPGLRLDIPHINVVDEGIFVCTVNITLMSTDGFSMMKSDNETISINVLYGPKITPMPRYSQIYGRSINRTCIVQSKPAATHDDVIWSKQGNSSFIQRGLHLYIPSIDKKDKGKFQCTVSITFQPTDGPSVSGSDSKPLEINVLYGPDIEPMNTFSQEDGYKIIKSCDVDSNPKATALDVTWTKRGNTSFIQNNKQLNISSINRVDKGTFICTVSIILIPTDGQQESKSATESIEVDVLFGPTIEPMTTYSPEEGDNFTIPCIVKSNPPAGNDDVIWTKQNESSFSEKGLQLSLFPVDKLDHGTYVCNAKITLKPTDQNHVVRTNSETVFINVLYQPVVSISEKKIVYEGNTTAAYCTVNSNPLSNITWTYLPTNTNVPESNNTFYSEYSKLSEIKFEQARCDNTGPYRCQASNNIKFPASKTVTINVKCKPRLSSLENKVENITIGRNESLNQTIEFHAYPKPTCDLMFNKTLVSEFKVDAITLDLPYKSGCRIEKNEVMEADIGPYEIIVQNLVGESVVKFYIIFQREPDPPLLHAIDCIGRPLAATIQWKPQWNGGLEQTFYVQYKKKEDLNFTHGEKFIDDGVKEMYMDTIYKLIPGKDYIFKVSASNDKGSTETHQVNCTAVGKDDPEADTLIVIGAITGSLLGLIIISVLTVFVVFLKRRTKIQKKSKKNTQLITSSSDRLEDDEDEDGLKVNPMYVSSGQIQSDKNRGAIYSVVQKANKEKTDEIKIDGDSSTVYSQVVKNEKKGKGNTSTSKKKKTGRPADSKDQSIEMDCVYENSNDMKYEDGDMYANTDTDKRTPVKNEYKPTKNKDGLIYADLDLAPGPNDKRFIIRGLENRNNYAVIDLSKTAEPLSSDSDTDDERDTNPTVETNGTGRQKERT